MRDREHEIQVSCVEWFRLRYPRGILFAIPNGGQRNVVVAAKMKAEGVLAGVPDLMIPMARGGFHGLFVEMKKSRVGKNGQLVDKGVLSDAQRVMIGKLAGEGYMVQVAYSVDDFMEIVERYMRLTIEG